MKAFGKFFLVAVILAVTYGMLHQPGSAVQEDESTYQEETEDNEETQDEEEYKYMNKKEMKKFRESCKKLDYKKVLRHPEKYEGKNFYTTVRINEAITGKAIIPGEAYCAGFLTYYNNDYSEYIDNYDRDIYLFDYQNPKSKKYVKMLEDDIVKVYGTFTGLSSSKNVLTWETSDTMALDVKYVKLLQE